MLLTYALTAVVVSISFSVVTSYDCQDPHTAALWPVVNYTYRSPSDFKICNLTHKLAEYNYDVHIDESLLQATLPINVTYNNPGLQALMHKIRCREKIHIVILGGSFTKGGGVFHGPARNMAVWNGRFHTWFSAAFPFSKVEFHSYAQGSTTSFYGMHILRQIRHPMDLLVIEYALNDHGSPPLSWNKTAHITEAIVRYVHKHHNKTALLYYGNNVFTAWHKNPENIQQQVCSAYGVHMLSYTRAVYDLMQACNHRNMSQPYPPDDDYCRPNPLKPSIQQFTLWEGSFHPTEPTHRLVAQAINYYITHAVKLYNESNFFAGEEMDSKANLPYSQRPMFSLHPSKRDAQVAESDCAVVLTDMTSIGSDEDVNSDQVTKVFRPVVAQGWNLRQDLPGKPYGWIAESKPSNESISKTLPKNHLAFSVLLVGGSFTITYLSTYENSGIFEVFMGVFDYDVNGGIAHSDLPPGALTCCNRSKTVPKPNIQRVGVSFSAYIDTLRPVGLSRVSEIKSAVINTGYRGRNFVLNIRHVPLSDEDRERRGGDKVKILGVSSCQ